MYCLALTPASEGFYVAQKGILGGGLGSLFTLPAKKWSQKGSQPSLEPDPSQRDLFRNGSPIVSFDLDLSVDGLLFALTP